MDIKFEAKYAPLVASLDFWKSVELDKLDTAANSIAEAQELSLAERKKLAEETKKWNKFSTEEKFSTMVGLLKIYQKEVDRLTSRAKQGEQAFLDVFQLLSRVPDFEASKSLVNELIQHSLQSSKLEVQNAKLKQEIEGYKSDLQELISQDVTVRKQEETIAKYESELKRLIQEGVIEAEHKIETQWQEEMARKEERIAQLVMDLKGSVDRNVALNRENESIQSRIQLVESRHSREMAAKQSEIELVSSEIDSLTHQNEVMKRQLEAIQNSDASTAMRASIDSINDSREEREELEIQLAQLTQNIHELSVKHEGLVQTHQIEVSDLESQLQRAQNRIQELELELTGRPNPTEYNDVKQKLSVLEGVQLYIGISDEDIKHGIKSGERGAAEFVIRDKIRKLERINLELKSVVKTLETQQLEWNESRSQLLLQLEEKDAAILRLEENLVDRSLQHPTSASIPKVLSPFISNPSNVTQSDDTEIPNKSSPLPIDRVDSMVQVLQSQRDKFKQRLQQCEAEKAALQEQLRNVSSKVQSLHEDNVKLYQKIQYLQSFPNSPVKPTSDLKSWGAFSSPSSSHSILNSSSHASQSSLASSSHDLEQGMNSFNSVEDKYKSSYEESINPFSIFNDREKSKRYADLNLAEKLVFHSTSFFMSSKNTRMILFGYLLIIHLLFMFITYKSATADAECKGK